MPKIKQSVETSVLNEHGEIVSKRANRVLSWGAEPPFIKLYLQDITYHADLPKNYSNILFELLKRMSYAGDKEGMVIVVNSYIKDKIAADLGLTGKDPKQSIDNAISKLVKGKLLIRIGRGTYRANPYFFGRGDWQDISRLRLEIDYDEIKGKTFKTVCGYKEDSNSQSFEQLELSLTGTDC